MTTSTGLFFAFVALFAWGFGDFFTEKTSRAIGTWKALLVKGIVGSVVLFPLVYKAIPGLFESGLILLSLLAVVALFASLFEFEALKEGKITVIEPIIGIELPVTVALSVALGQELLSHLELLLISGVFIGIVLAITKHHSHLHYHKRMLVEKGVIFAGIGAIGMGLMHYLVGVSSQTLSPLLAIWFADLALTVACGLYLFARGEWKHFGADVATHWAVVLPHGILDNTAWISYAIATTAIPIAIATTVSESFIILAVLLGIFINKEKLRSHQWIGVCLAIACVIVLSYLAE